MKKLLVLFLAAMMASGIFAGCTNGTGDKTPDTTEDKRNLNAYQYSLYNLTATDALGRKIKAMDGRKEGERYVGLFYSVWLGQHPESQKGNWNIQYLLDTDPEALNTAAGHEKSPLGEFHFWNEPLYGYYNMRDPWVAARHVELLTLAGVDYLCIDATNDKVYRDSTDNLLDTLLKFQKQGWDVPKVVFYTNSYSGRTVDTIYGIYYQTEKYDSLWFTPAGKPMIIGITENNRNASDQTKYSNFNTFISKEMQHFFDVRESQWPNGDYNEEAIPWMSWQSPQWNHNGSVAVPVAQHSHSKIVASLMHPESSRAYNNHTRKVDGDWKAGKSFQTMWDNVHNSTLPVTNVMVTSFNEWMAIKSYGEVYGGVYFVDVFNDEYSRDIEMMKGGYGDNFLLQLIQNIRQYKYTDGKKYKPYKMSIDINNAVSLAQWEFVSAHYKDFVGDAMARNFAAAAGTEWYTDNSNRNDFTDIKVTHDNSNIYFYIKTLDDVTPYNGTDKNWMNLFISTGASDGFAGFDFVVNRSPSDSTTSVEKSLGGYSWTNAGEAQYKIYGDVMQIAIPLSSLGLSADNLNFNFKVSDNVTEYEDIMDYYVTGDSAPVGRLGFAYSG